jgi:hypothetical protein
MTDFFKKTVTLTPRYAKKLRAMWHSGESIFVVEYLSEFKSICKTVLAHESGDAGVQLNKKTEGQKSRETVLLTECMDHKLSAYSAEQSWP